MKPLERGQRWVMLIHGMAVALIVLAAASGISTALYVQLGVPPAYVLLPVLVLLIYPALVGPVRHYRSWGYRMDEEELRLAHGVITQTDRARLRRLPAGAAYRRHRQQRGRAARPLARDRGGDARGNP